MRLASLRQFVYLALLGLGLFATEVRAQSATTDPVGFSVPHFRRCAYPMCGGVYAFAPSAPGHPWEGAWPDGGAGTLVNSRTLARQTNIPFTGWIVRGGMPVGFGLHHNSLATRSNPALGGNWLHSYDTRLVLAGAGNEASIQWAHLEQKFTQAGGAWTPADGYRDNLTTTVAGSFLLTTHNQFKFSFEPTADPLVHRLKSIKDTSGNAITLLYNAAGRLTQVKDPDARSLKFSYDGAGRLKQVRYVAATFSSRWTLAYDAGGLLDKITWPSVTTEAGVQAYSAYCDMTTDGGGWTAVVGLTDRRGQVWSFGHQGRQALWDQYPGNTALQRVNYLVTPLGSRRTDPTGVALTHEYDAKGRLLRSIDGQGHSTTFAYADAQYAWAPSSVTNAVGDVAMFDYDARANAVGITPAGLGRFDLTYNSKNRLTKVLKPLVTNADGGVDASRRRTDYVYDTKSRLTMVRQYTGAATFDETLQRGYDTQGLCLSQTDALGQVTDYTYNAMGNMLSVTTPAGRVTSWDWTDPLLTSGFRLPQSMQIAGGPGTTYAYDAWGRLRDRMQADASGASYHYDAMSRLVKMVDATGTSLWTYDARGWPTQESASGWNVSMTYDPAGRPLGATENGAFGQASISYAYDALGWLASQTDGVTSQYSYDDAGRLVRTDLPNGLATLRSFTAGLLTRQTHEVSGSLKYQWDYSYQANGALMRKIELDGHQTKYLYDFRDRLARELRTGPLPNHTIDYAYDSASRRTSRITDGLTGIFSYDADGLVQTLSVPNTTYAWDPAGRLASIQNASGLRTLSYDDVGRLTQAISPTGRDDYQYDGLNRRVRYDERNTGGALLASSSFRYLGGALRREERTVGAATTQLPVRWGPGGLESFFDIFVPVGRNVADSSGTRGLLDSNGNAVAFAAVYDASGRTLEHTGANTKYQWGADAGARTEGAASLINLGGSAWFEPEAAVMIGGGIVGSDHAWANHSASDHAWGSQSAMSQGLGWNFHWHGLVENRNLAGSIKLFDNATEMGDDALGGAARFGCAGKATFNAFTVTKKTDTSSGPMFHCQTDHW